MSVRRTLDPYEVAIIAEALTIGQGRAFAQVNDDDVPSKEAECGPGA